MVEVDVEIPGVVAKGKLLTLTAAEAIQHKVANLSGDTVEEALAGQFRAMILVIGERHVLAGLNLVLHTVVEHECGLAVRTPARRQPVAVVGSLS